MQAQKKEIPVYGPNDNECIINVGLRVNFVGDGSPDLEYQPESMIMRTPSSDVTVTQVVLPPKVLQSKDDIGVEPRVPRCVLSLNSFYSYFDFIR